MEIGFIYSFNLKILKFNSILLRHLKNRITITLKNYLKFEGGGNCNYI